MSYKKLEIWQIANDLVIKIHRMTLNELPKFELYFELHEKIEILGRKLNNFINSVEKKHNTLLESGQNYLISNVENQETRIE